MRGIPINPSSPRGIPQVEVTFGIDADGILKVSAVDKATGNTQAITIHASSGLSDNEVKRMKGEAKEFAEHDRALRDVAQARNDADQAVYTAEKILRDYGDRVSSSTQGELKTRMEEVRNAIDKKDTGILRQSTDSLSDTITKVGTELQNEGDTQSNGDEQGQSDPTHDTTSEDEVQEI